MKKFKFVCLGKVKYIKVKSCSECPHWTDLDYDFFRDTNILVHGIYSFCDITKNKIVDENKINNDCPLEDLN